VKILAAPTELYFRGAATLSRKLFDFLTLFKPQIRNFSSGNLRENLPEMPHSRRAED
jgi:hypothetical protein